MFQFRNGIFFAPPFEMLCCLGLLAFAVVFPLVFTSHFIQKASEKCVFNECVKQTIKNSLGTNGIVVINLERQYDDLTFLQHIQTPLIIYDNVYNLSNLKNILIYGNNKNVSVYSVLLQQFAKKKNILIINDGSTMSGDEDDDNVKSLLASNWKLQLNKVGFVSLDGNGGILGRSARNSVIKVEKITCFLGRIRFTSTLRLDRIDLCGGGNLMLEKRTNYCSGDGEIVHEPFLTPNEMEEMCRIKIAWLQYEPFVQDVKAQRNPGIMVSMLRLFAERQRVKLIFQEDNTRFEEEFATNGSFYQLIKSLVNKEHDLAIGHLVMNDTRTVPLNYGPLVCNDSVFLAVRKPKKSQSYRKLLVIFDADMWMKFFYTFVMVFCVYVVFAFVLGTRNDGIADSFMKMFSLTISCSLPALPKRLTLRVLVVFYSFFCICIDSVYLGKLSSIFSHASYDLPVNSALAILNFNISFFYSWYLERLLLVRYVAAAQNFKDKYEGYFSLIGNHSGLHYFERLAVEQSFGTFIFRSQAQTLPIQLSRVDVSSDLAIYMNFYVTYLIRPNGVHVEESLAFWSKEMIEKGFIIKWWDDIIEARRNRSLIPPDEKQQIILTVAHFEEIFQVLFVGYAVSVGLLFIEIVYHWIDAKFEISVRVKESFLYFLGLLKPPKEKRMVKLH